jgi:hypothetical protein
VIVFAFFAIISLDARPLHGVEVNIASDLPSDTSALAVKPRYVDEDRLRSKYLLNSRRIAPLRWSRKASNGRLSSMPRRRMNRQGRQGRQE